MTGLGLRAGVDYVYDIPPAKTMSYSLEEADCVLPMLSRLIGRGLVLVGPKARGLYRFEELRLPCSFRAGAP